MVMQELRPLKRKELSINRKYKYGLVLKDYWKNWKDDF